MIGFITAIVVFNLIAFITNKRLTKGQIVHIWTFTVALMAVSETYIDFKYHGYWYFTEPINWWVLPAFTLIVPPVNIMFLNWFPFKKAIYKRMFYVLGWAVTIVLYEGISLLPEPWGYFHYGWWRLWYSMIIDPFLLLIVLYYYKWIRKIEGLKREPES